MPKFTTTCTTAFTVIITTCLHLYNEVKVSQSQAQTSLACVISKCRVVLIN